MDRERMEDERPRSRPFTPTHSRPSRFRRRGSDAGPAEVEVVAVVSDLHINSTVGLCPGPVPLDDGGTHQPSKEQRALLRCWNEYWAEIDEWAEGRRPHPQRRCFAPAARLVVYWV